jgi:hypothetical protein
VPTETIRLPAKGPHVHSGSMVFFAVLAYPNPKDRSKRLKFIEVSKSWCCRLFIEQGGNPALVKERYRKWRPSRIRKNSILVNGLRRIHNHRLLAADMWAMSTIGKFSENKFRFYGYGEIIKSISSAARFTANVQNPHTQIFPRKDTEASDNILRRNWSSSKPVLHLAVSLQNYARRNHYFTPSGYLDSSRLFTHTDWLERAIRQAENLRNYYFPLTIKGYDIDKTIQVLIRND